MLPSRLLQIAWTMTLSFILGSCVGGSSAPRASTPAPGATQTGSAAVPSPVADGGEQVNGIRVESLTVGSPVSLPANLAVYYVPAGYGKDGTLPDLRRVGREVAGPLREERLFKDLGTVYSMALNLDQQVIGFGVCENMARGTNCGTPSFAALGDPIATGYISTDNGATFTNLGRLPRNAWIYAAVDGQHLIGVSDPDVPGAGTRFEYFPSGAVLRSPVPGAIPRASGRVLTWLADGGALYAADGLLLHKPRAFGQPAGTRVSVTSTGFVETWWIPGPGGPGQQTSTFYVGIFDAAGTLQRVFSWKADIRPIVAVSMHEILGNFGQVTGQGLSFPAMILDLDKGVIHPILELTEALRAAGDLREPFIVGAQPRARN